jgi:hypothetical protein
MHLCEEYIRIRGMVDKALEYKTQTEMLKCIKNIIWKPDEK